MKRGGYEIVRLEKGRQDRVSVGEERYLGWESVKRKPRTNSGITPIKQQTLANRVTGRALQSSHSTWAVKTRVRRQEMCPRHMPCGPSSHRDPVPAVPLLGMPYPVSEKANASFFRSRSHHFSSQSIRSETIKFIYLEIFKVCFTMHNIYC